MITMCCDKERRVMIDNQDLLNGIDYLDVVDREAATEAERQRILQVHFLRPLQPPRTVPGKGNVLLKGGERTTSIVVEDATIDPGDSRVLEVKLDRYGDFSTYILKVVKAPGSLEPPDDFDPVLSSIAFSFKVECPSDFDCGPTPACPPVSIRHPDIDYLARDYASFRRLLFDRMALTAPQWKDRNAADLGVALVELLAYVGDRLSYRQDAVATEAYLSTARRRVSVRRHARLVDYFVHDGSNARVWVHIRVSQDVVLARKAGAKVLHYSFLTRSPGLRACVSLDSVEYQQALRSGAECFELLEDRGASKNPILLFKEHNTLTFYTWADRECCLPIGTTHATLEGHFTHLCPGDVLILEERKNPRTRMKEDADPAHRHPVRLTEIRCSDGRGDPLIDPLTAEMVTEITWQDDDALPFPLCISSRTDAKHGGIYVDHVSVARGNIVLVDHGRRVTEDLGEAPPAIEYKTVWHGTKGAACFGTLASGQENSWCDHRELVTVPPRFRPPLHEGPVTQAAVYTASASADAAMRWDLRDCLPSAALESQPESRTWGVRRDLLNSDPEDAHFVVEIESDAKATLRFGDDVHGRRPGTGEKLTVTYRAGNGVSGNVGAGSVAHLILSPGAPVPAGAIESVRNPMPAKGGIEPETIEEVRQKAPYAFRIQERAVTEADYAEVTGRHREVQKAAATFRWTGSWYTVFLSPDRVGGKSDDPGFKTEIRNHVERFRMAGHDLEVNAPVSIALEIGMTVCAKPGFFRGCVKRALLDVFSSRLLADGHRGIFHPDNFTLGQTVYLSVLYAAAQAVEGVQSVEVNLFQEWHNPARSGLDGGFMEMGRLEIPRLDNDPNYPEHGVFRVEVKGGK
jgi:hypothetical protein